MNSAVLGLVAVIVVMLWFVFERWRRLSPTGEYEPRTEWRYWLFALTVVVFFAVVTFGGWFGRVVVLPIGLIGLGLYLLRLPRSLGQVAGLDLRATGWIAIVVGLLNGAIALAALAQDEMLGLAIAVVAVLTFAVAQLLRRRSRNGAPPTLPGA